MSGKEHRKYWIDTMVKIVQPVLEALANKELKAVMPVEGKTTDRPLYTHLEALGRTLTGIAPWLENGSCEGEEGEQRRKYSELSRKAIDAAVDPESPDFLNFSEGFQPIVDAAFLSHALVRAPKQLLEKLEDTTKKNLIKALKATRNRKPGFNNWLLFAAMTETALYLLGEEDWDPMRIDYAIKQHEQWYVGDGMYGDGAEFHWDYYNSYVIQPMLVDIIITMGDKYDEWKKLKTPILEIAKRYAAIQERLISQDGTFPIIGRSIAYRFGAFQALAQTAYKHMLPEELKPAQIRCALTAVIRKCIEAKGTFDDNGWLRIGLCGSQPDLGEGYISTGSLYLCAAVFLPLGLDEKDEFWSGEDTPWTAVKLWSGENMKADHALYLKK